MQLRTYWTIRHVDVESRTCPCSAWKRVPIISVGANRVEERGDDHVNAKDSHVPKTILVTLPMAMITLVP